MTNPRYRAIADLLRDKIASGALATGGALPTEVELCAEHGVSRSTMRKALGLLREEGWIESRQGSGWSVLISHRGRQFGTFRLRVTEGAGSDAVTRTLGCDRRRPPPGVASTLATDRRRQLLVVERLTESNALPVHRSEVWFNPSLSKTLDVEEAKAESPAKLLANRGHEFGPFDQYAEAVLADRRDHDLLNVDVGTAVLQVVRTARTASGTPLFQSLHRHPGPVVQLEIGFPTTDQAEGLFVGLHRSPLEP